MLATLQAGNEATDTRERSAAVIVFGTSSQKKPHRDRRRRIAEALDRVRWASYLDSLFERPDIIEDDYYRLSNQPRG